MVSSKRKLVFSLLLNAGRCELDFDDAHCNGHPLCQIFFLLFNPGSVVDVESPHHSLLCCLFFSRSSLVGVSLTSLKILLAVVVTATFLVSFCYLTLGVLMLNPLAVLSSFVVHSVMSC